MTIGSGIFLASLVLGAIVLFGITKDRWNWPKIARRTALGFLGLIVVTAAGLYAWNAIDEAQLAAKAKLALEKEKRARVCIAGDLPRMEKLARSIQESIHDDMSLEDAKAVADKISNGAGQIVPPETDIKERVLIYKLPTQCDSAFYFLVNIRANDEGALKWLRISAKDPPAGYSEGLHSEFSTEFARIRAEKLSQESASYVNALEARRVASEKQHRADTDTDPCAPHLSEDERLRRLATFGKVRETGEREYSAGSHHVVFYYDGSLEICD